MKKLVLMAIFAIIVVGIAGCAQKSNTNNANKYNISKVNTTKLIKRIQDIYNSTTSFSGNESVVVHVTYPKSITYRSNISFVVKKPNKFWIYNLDDKKYEICNGTYLWKYDKKNNTVTVSKIVPNMPLDDYSKAILTLNLRQINVTYIGNKTFNNTQYYTLKITPKNRTNYNFYEYLYINSKYRPIGFQFSVSNPRISYNGSVHFYNMKFNTSVNDKFFNFTIPEGARVRKVVEQIKLEKYDTIKEAQKHVNFKILVPKYTSGFKIDSVYTFGDILMIKYTKEGSIMIIKEMPTLTSLNVSKAEKVNINGVTGYYWTKNGNSIIAFMRGNLSVVISAPLTKTEITKVASSMV